jgi:lipoprotein signal peptidase
MKITFSGLVFAFLIFTDQIAKIASDFYSGGSRFINPICNSNIAWSVPVKPAFFYPLWFAIIFLLARLLSQTKDYQTRTALIFILSGAVSNMIDRVSRGCVTDFIDLKFWPVFNLADIYITMGVVTLLTIKILNSKH